jgi:hypothetical protein
MSRSFDIFCQRRIRRSYARREDAVVADDQRRVSDPNAWVVCSASAARSLVCVPVRVMVPPP